MRSAGKSITSLAVGIAIDRGLIRRVDVPLTTLLPDPSAPDKAGIKLEDVLTMRSGLDADDENAESAGNEDRMDRAPDWLAFALRVPMKDTPGRTYTYSSVNAFLAGAVVERATGGPLDVFATKHLFEPLGITKTSGGEVRTIGRRGRAIFGCACATWPASARWCCTSGSGQLAAGREQRVDQRSLTGIVPIGASDGTPMRMATCGM